MRAPSFSLLFLASCAVVIGCSSEDDKSGPPSGGFTSTSGATTSTSGGAGGGGGASGSSTSATTTTGSSAGPAHCAKSCAMDVDCCPAGATDCPGDAPNNNYSCGDGICIPAHCLVDANCPIGTCHEIGGLGSCFNVCTIDDDCAIIPNGSCSGVADDGAKYCTVTAAPCAADTDCAGLGKCDEQGGCTCDTDADCTAPSVDTCAK